MQEKRQKSMHFYFRWIYFFESATGTGKPQEPGRRFLVIAFLFFNRFFSA